MVPFAGYSMPVQYDFKDALAARCKGGVLADMLEITRYGLPDNYFTAYAQKVNALKKSDINERRETNQSLMPSNFGEALPVSDFYSLLAFLLSQTGKG